MKTKISVFIIDALKDFMTQTGSMYVSNSEEIIPNIVSILEKAHKEGWDVCAVMDQHQYSCAEFIENFGPFPKHCILNSDGGTLIKEIQETLCATFVTKDYVDVWNNEKFAADFDASMLEHPNQTVIIVGVASDYCVKAAISGFLSRGVSVYVPENCVRGINEQFTPEWFDQESRLGLLFSEPEFNHTNFSNWNSYCSEWLVAGDCKMVAERIEEFIRDQVVFMKKRGAVVGISGGMDSALVAVASHYALRGTDKKLHGLHLPSGKITNDYQIAKFLGAVCNFFSKLTLGTSIKVAEKAMMGPTPYLTSAEANPLNYYDRGNMISRSRANFIHTYAAQHDLLVIGTGNKDEDFGVGYYTLFGDGAVHCSPIGDLSKRMVKHMLRYYLARLDEDGYHKTAFAVNNVIDKEPSAGLEPNQTDFKDLGYSYEFVEAILATVLESRERFSIPLHHVAELVFDRDAIRAKKLKCEKFDSMLNATADVLRRHQIANMKSALVSPQICKINVGDMVKKAQ